MSRKLTARERRFADEYLIDCNAVRAAVRAGYSARSAPRHACRLLKRPAVAAAVAEGQARLAARAEVSAERVLRELARIAFSDHRRLYDAEGRLRPLHELDPDTAAILAGVETLERPTPGGGARTVVSKVKVWDKGAALALLGRHLGLLGERAETGGAAGLDVRIAAARKRLDEKKGAPE